MRGLLPRLNSFPKMSSVLNQTFVEISLVNLYENLAAILKAGSSGCVIEALSGSHLKCGAVSLYLIN